MRSTTALLISLLVLLSSCAARGTPQPITAQPSAAKTPPVGEAPSPAPVPLPTVRHNGDRVEVFPLNHDRSGYYLWSPDWRFLVFQTKEALWSISPDGTGLRQLARLTAPARLAGWWQGSLVYTEQQADGLQVTQLHQGDEPRIVGRIAHPAQEQYEQLLTSDRLILIGQYGKVQAVDLATGATGDLGDEPLPALAVGNYSLSPDRRLLAYKLRVDEDPVRLLDLQTGKTIRTGSSNQVGSAQWTSAGDRWAVLGVDYTIRPPKAPGTEPNGDGDQLDVGDTSGKEIHLQPPGRLRLFGGPCWSPDGKSLAVMSFPQPGDPDQKRSLWIVTLASGHWERLASFPSVGLLGWQPDGQHVVLSESASTSLRVSTSDGRVEKLANDQNSAAVDPRTAPIDTYNALHEPVGGQTERGVQGGYMAWLEWQPMDTLVIKAVPLPHT